MPSSGLAFFLAPDDAIVCESPKMCGARLDLQLDAWLLSPHLRKARITGGRIGDSSPRIFVNFRPEKSDFDLCEVFFEFKKNTKFCQILETKLSIASLLLVGCSSR